MINNNRQRKIVELISQKGNVTVDELAATFNVSKMTIRRDLEKLQDENLVKRTHGGALVNKVLLHEMAYHEKREENLPIKRCIAKEAIKLIEPSKTIYLDAGTTTYEIAVNLGDMDLTVITNDIRIAAHLMLTNNKVIFLGGTVLKETGSTTDHHAINHLKEFNIDIAVIATSSIDDEMYLCTPELDRKIIKETAIHNADKTILVTDNSKFYRKSLHKIAPLSIFDVIITDLEKEKLASAHLETTEVISLLCPVEEDINA